MKKLKKFLTAVLSFALCAASFIGLAAGCSSNKDKEIRVCASDVPHAEVLEGVVKSELEKKGYTLKVKVLDWTAQNDAVANGEPCKREIVEHHGGAAILCVTGGKIAFVKQYRYAYGKEVLEIPAGKLEAGEDPLNAAKRELKEETGVSAEKFEKIAEVYPSPGYTNEIIYIYRAYPVSAGAASPDPDEFLSVLWIGEEDAEKMLKSGEISDAKTIIALQRYFWEKASR